MAQLSYLNTQHIDDLAAAMAGDDLATAKQILDTSDDDLLIMLQPQLDELIRIITPTIQHNVVHAIKQHALTVHLSQYEQLRIQLANEQHDQPTEPTPPPSLETDRPVAGHNTPSHPTTHAPGGAPQT